MICEKVMIIQNSYDVCGYTLCSDCYSLVDEVVNEWMAET